jgi:hypothetical protein
MALTPRTQKVCGRKRVVINAAAAISSSDSASNLARLSSAILSMRLRIEAALDKMQKVVEEYRVFTK